MHRWFTVSLVLFSVTLGAFPITDSTRTASDLYPYADYWRDDAFALTLADIRADSEGQQISQQQAYTTADPSRVWTRIGLTNKTDRPVSRCLVVAAKARDVMAYFYTGASDTVSYTLRTGRDLPRAEKPIPANGNKIPYTLYPGDSVTVILSLAYDHGYHLSHTFLYDADRTRVEARTRSMATSVTFYLGTCAVFMAVALLLLVLFRERLYMYFTLIVLAFAAYFVLVNDYHGELIEEWTGLSAQYLHMFSVLGVVWGITLFFGEYLQLSRHAPRWYRLLQGGAYAVLACVVVYHFYQNPMWWYHLYNAVIMIWMLVAIAAPLIVLRTQRREATVLLLSVAVLFGSALLLVGYYVINPNAATNYAALDILQYSTALFTGVLFYSLFDRILRLQRTKRHLEVMDVAKSHFFENISHELRTPLTLIKDPIDRLARAQQDPAQREMLDLAAHHTDRLLHLVNGLLDLAKLETGNMELQAQPLDLAHALRGIVHAYDSQAQQKHIDLTYAAPDTPVMVYVDTHKFEQTCYNLLSNAFKFTPPGGAVTVELSEVTDEEVRLRIADTGIGISEAKLTRIFDRFYQVDDSATRAAEGTGIGLALVQELVERHGGRVTVQSRLGAGTVFELYFRMGKAHLSPLDVATPNDTAQPVPAPTVPVATVPIPESLDELTHSSQETTDADSTLTDTDIDARPTILVVEDHPDVRRYLTDYLARDYRLLTAPDGQAGIDAAIAHTPDLIISDVMMPHRDGYDLCRTLKQDLRTSHIPIILLTARAGQDARLTGLEGGADVYLAKPFDTRELGVQVRNLIGLRRLLRQRYAQQVVSVAPVPVADTATPDAPELPEAIHSPMEMAFLAQVDEIIDARLDDAQLGVESLAEAVHLSRSQLNRKLKALTDLTASRYLRARRLRHAHELLQREALTVSEVAHRTGFSSSAYFVKVFGEAYGVTPGQVQRGG